MDIKTIYQTEQGKIIRQHLEEYVNTLNSVTEITGSDPFEIAVQTQARKMAIKTLKDILFLTEYEETNKKEINKEKYGL